MIGWWVALPVIVAVAVYAWWKSFLRELTDALSLPA